MTKRGGGFGQPGPRTFEQKGWRSEILKPLYLAFGFGILLNLAWVLVTVYLWLDDHTWFAYLWDNPKDWWKVIVVEWLVVGVYLILKWSETFWDDDYTTLSGDHPLLGILPMRPLTRLILFVRWWRARKEKTPTVNPSIDVTIK